MLYLMRKIGQSIMINNNIEVKVIEIKGKNVKLGFDFPKEASVLRKEVFDHIMEENINAAQQMEPVNVKDLLAALESNSDESKKDDNE